MIRRFPPLRQNAFVVPDLEAALDHWTRVMNVGPFFVYEHVDYGGVTYRGQPTAIDASVAMGWWGDVQIELIEQHNDAPSIYRDFLRSGRTGLQHMGTYTTSYHEDLARLAGQGLRPVEEGGAGIGVHFCYLEPGAGSGWMVELIEATPAMMAANEELRALARDWDGRDPVRRMVAA